MNVTCSSLIPWVLELTLYKRAMKFVIFNQLFALILPINDRRRGYIAGFDSDGMSLGPLINACTVISRFLIVWRGL